MAEHTTCDIQIQLHGNQLTADINPRGGSLEEDVFFVYLLRNEKIYSRSNTWGKSKKISWELSESGLYSLQGHIKRKGVNTVSWSSPVLYLTPGDEDNFHHYMSHDFDSIPEMHEDDLFLSSYPYADFAFVRWRGSTDFADKAKRFANRFGLDCSLDFMADNSCLLASPGRIKNISGKKFVFSGSCFSSGKLLFGDNDLTDIADLIHDEPVGNYTYIVADDADGSFSCGADYFGICKIFYFQSDTACVIANSYHLLLLLARDLGQPIEMNSMKVAATLVFATMQPFHQNFSRHMDVSPVQVMPPDKAVYLADCEIKLRDTSLAQALSRPLEYDEEEYRKLLSKAKTEILDNVRSVLSCPSFEHVIVDLSGGLDTRITFCAATNFPEYSHKLKINCQYSAIEPDDLPVALEVASLYNYDFDDLTRHKRFIKKEAYLAHSWSYNLGMYYSYIPQIFAEQLHRTSRINGFYGEICARPYYSRKLLNEDIGSDSVEDFCDYYFDKFKKSAISPSTFGLNSLRQLFSDEMERLPGRSPLEKFDLHYLFFRNGLHCSDRFRNSLACPEFGPIMSKSLFAAKMMGFHIFKSAKVEFDIINLLNPILACVRYQGDYDNQDKKNIKESAGLLSEPWIEGLCVRTENIRDKWETTSRKVLDESKTIDHKERVAFNEAYRNFDINNRELALNLLKDLHKERIIISDEDLTRSIWYILSGSEADAFTKSARWNIVNRLVSIHTQMKIVHGSTNGSGEAPMASRTQMKNIRGSTNESGEATMTSETQFMDKWVLSCPKDMDKVFDDIPHFSQKYLETVVKGAGCDVKNGAIFSSDYDGLYAKVKDGLRSTTGTPTSFKRTIYCVGPSFVYGSYCEDSGTISSHLQALCNNKYADTYLIKNYGTKGLSLEFFALQLSSLPLEKDDTLILISRDQVRIGEHDVHPGEFIKDLYLKCQERGVKFCFFLYPRLAEVITPSDRELLLLNNTFETLYNNGPYTTSGFTPPSKYSIPPIISQLTIAGCPCFDLQLAVNRPHDQGEIFIDRGHLSGKGYRLLAEFISDNYISQAHDSEQLDKSDRKRVEAASYHVFANVIRRQYRENKSINSWLEGVKAQTSVMADADKIGSIIMNCNPFTKGHLYLIEIALKQVDFLYIFIVEEDRSDFEFADRIRLVNEGTAHLSDRVRVLPSGQFIISTMTFPEYFNKTELTATSVDSSSDVAIFGAVIAPELNISVRFIGEEPFCNVTRQYNETMKRILPPMGVEVCEIKRLEIDGEAISASQVRKYIKDEDWDNLKNIVPESTRQYLRVKDSMGGDVQN